MSVSRTRPLKHNNHGTEFRIGTRAPKDKGWSEWKELDSKKTGQRPHAAQPPKMTWYRIYTNLAERESDSVPRERSEWPSQYGIWNDLISPRQQFFLRGPPRYAAKPGTEAVQRVSEVGANTSQPGQSRTTSCMPETKKWADEGTGCEEQGFHCPKVDSEVEHEYTKTCEEQEKCNTQHRRQCFNQPRRAHLLLSSAEGRTRLCWIAWVGPRSCENVGIVLICPSLQ
jgi:hypothetical protein